MWERVAGRGDLRHGLREHMKDSPLCDALQFAGAMELAFRNT
jgi:hypothetical protein